MGFSGHENGNRGLRKQGRGRAFRRRSKEARSVVQ